MTMTGTMTGTGVADRSERGTKRIDSVEGMKREVHIEAEASERERMHMLCIFGCQQQPRSIQERMYLIP